MSPSVSVLLVDDHELLAETLRVALSSEGVPCELVTPTSLRDVLRGVERQRPRLTLLDLDLGPRVGDGTALVGPIRALGGDVLVVTGATDPGAAAAAVEAGAIGYVPKSAPFDQLLVVVRRALAGEQVLSDCDRFELLARLRVRRAERRMSRAPFERLSPREQEVLRELADGRGVEAISARAVVSQATVRTQVRAILTKLGVSTQLAAVARARQAGWLDDPGGEQRPVRPGAA